METSASVTISTEQKIKNLQIACQEVASRLRYEGRRVAALDLEECADLLDFALTRYDQISHSHD